MLVKGTPDFQITLDTPYLSETYVWPISMKCPLWVDTYMYLGENWQCSVLGNVFRKLVSGLAQGCDVSIANALDLLQSCIPSQAKDMMLSYQYRDTGYIDKKIRYSHDHLTYIMGIPYT